MKTTPPTNHPLKAKLFLDDHMYSKGEVIFHKTRRFATFHPTSQTLLSTAYPRTKMIVEDIDDLTIFVTNLRQCSASKTHWEMEVDLENQ